MKLILKYTTGDVDYWDNYLSFEGEDKAIELIKFFELAENSRGQYFRVQNEIDILNERYGLSLYQEAHPSRKEWLEKYKERDKINTFNFHGHKLNWNDFYRLKEEHTKKGRVKSEEWIFEEPTILTLDEFWVENLPVNQ